MKPRQPPRKLLRRPALLLAAVLLAGAMAIAGWLNIEPTPQASESRNSEIAHAAPELRELQARPSGTLVPQNENPSIQKAQADPRSEPPLATAAAIGSEGYAPHIQAALDSGSAAAAYQAVQQLNRCQRVGGNIEGARKYATQTAGLSAEKASHALSYVSYLEAEQRRCQTVTPQIEALRTPLLLKATLGGETGAAADYIKTAPQADLTQPDRQAQVLDALRADALRGDESAMRALAKASTLPFNVPPSLRRSAEYAWLQTQLNWYQSQEGEWFESRFLQQLEQLLGPANIGGLNPALADREQIKQRLAELQSPDKGLSAEENRIAAEMLAAAKRKKTGS
ncbi:UNVERIFIED_ORG: hypothetical protein LHJ69_02220 [Shinella sp. XGS7]|nr:hypothetical protein [Shinella sp. XGS7]